MKKLFFMFVILFSAVLSPFGSASAEENSGKSWVSKADLPEVRSAAATAVVDGKIYVIGGFGSENIATNTTYVYDPKTNEWTQKTDMPTKRAGAAVAVVDHKIYVIGGNTYNTSNYANTEKVEIYDYKTDTWESGVDAPVKSYLSSAAVIDNTIHLFTQQGPSMPTHFAYNTATKKWETKYRQPRNNSGAAAATVNGKIYYIGGGTHNSGGSLISGFIYEYDPKTDNWIKKSNLKSLATYVSAAVVGNKIYIAGGAIGKNSVTSKVQVYDPKSDTVEEIQNLQYKRAGAATVAVGKDLYAIGGSESVNLNSLHSSKFRSVEMLSLDSKNPNDDNQGKTDDKDQSEEGAALLVITMVNGLQKEYQLSIKEVNAFLSWYKQRDAGEGPGFYEIDEHDNNKGPFESKKDYVVFNNILMFEVNKYKK
ncbi:Kelch repeat-containing protein [Bacillus paralicheniformis]|uniref:Kelch repeat-containing protein n=1 Tax=Bacillus paralicheniformis TaxID=1648923 RepID=UPI0011EDC43B|nr:kelch repeat-containing protein [Bacillus paralicheniformis]KAA0836943.1 DUF1668 domain-containing protein [Bacillus paralicheniformis]KAA0843071.1 DUF1668 domain-containing protein [Bacillus paralicheniformis]